MIKNILLNLGTIATVASPLTIKQESRATVIQNAEPFRIDNNGVLNTGYVYAEYAGSGGSNWLDLNFGVNHDWIFQRIIDNNDINTSWWKWVTVKEYYQGTQPNETWKWRFDEITYWSFTDHLAANKDMHFVALPAHSTLLNYYGNKMPLKHNFIEYNDPLAFFEAESTYKKTFIEHKTDKGTDYKFTTFDKGKMVEVIYPAPNGSPISYTSFIVKRYGKYYPNMVGGVTNAGNLYQVYFNSNTNEVIYVENGVQTIHQVTSISLWELS